MNAEKIHVETLENVLIKDLVINASAKQDLQDTIVKMVSGLSFFFISFHFGRMSVQQMLFPRVLM